MSSVQYFTQRLNINSKIMQSSTAGISWQRFFAVELKMAHAHNDQNLIGAIDKARCSNEHNYMGTETQLQAAQMSHLMILSRKMTEKTLTPQQSAFIAHAMGIEYGLDIWLRAVDGFPTIVVGNKTMIRIIDEDNSAVDCTAMISAYYRNPCRFWSKVPDTMCRARIRMGLAR